MQRFPPANVARRRDVRAGTARAGVDRDRDRRPVRARRRRDRARARRRQLRGSAAVLRRAGRARGRRRAPCPSSRPSATSRTRRSATSPPTCARRRRPHAARLVVPDLKRAARARSSGRATRCTAARSARVERHAQRLATAHERLRRAPLLALERKRARLDTLHARLGALSPVATLERGYAIVRRGDEVVRVGRPGRAGRRALDPRRRRHVRSDRRSEPSPTLRGGADASSSRSSSGSSAATPGSTS